jgi:hypothetical protein
MKYLLVLIIGIISGAVIFAAGVAFNPFVSKQGLSPLAVTDSQTVTLTYSGVASDGIVFTNDGESRVSPHPEKVLQLWEASIRQTSASVKELRDGRGQVAGLGIKMSSLSEATRLFAGKAIVDSVWYVYLPGRGGMFIEQTENYWDFLRGIVLPAYRSSANTWQGNWLGNLTAGPGALGTAKATGSSGEFSGLEMLAVESLVVRAWRTDGGSLAAEGQLLIELPPELSDDSSVDESPVDEAFVEDE